MREKNYEKYQLKNNFKKTKGIKSKLILGDEKINENILISFYIPTFNRIETLIESVNSILNLTMIESINYEIIVVDDSADFTDSNKNYLYFKSINHPKIKYYINEKNIGIFNNWNRGIELANGKYFVIQHDDDLLHKDYLVEILKCLKNANKYENFGFIQTRRETFYDTNNLPNVELKSRGGIKKIKLIDSILEGIGPTCAPTCGTIFLKKALIESGGYDEFLYPSADQILGFIIIEKGYKGYITEDSLGYYRVAYNTSRSKSTIKSFIEKDYYICNYYIYKSTNFSKIFGLVFSNVQYSLRIDTWLYLAKNKYHVDICLEDIDFKKSYHKYRIGKLFMKFLISINNKSKITSYI